MLRRLLIIVLIATLMAPMALRKVYAYDLYPLSSSIMEASGAIVSFFINAFGSNSMAYLRAYDALSIKTIIGEVTSYFRVLREKLRFDAEKKIAKAHGDNKQAIRKAALMADIARQNIVAPDHRVCRESTANRRVQVAQRNTQNTVNAVTTGSIGGAFGNVSRPQGGGGRGAASGSGGGGSNPTAPAAPPAAVTDVVSSFQQKICDTDPNAASIKACEGHLPEPAPAGAANPDLPRYAFADVNPQTLLGGSVYEDGDQASYAMRVCENITANTRRDIVSGKSILSSLENAGAFSRAAAEIAAQQQAYLICMTAWGVRVPHNNDFADALRDAGQAVSNSDPAIAAAAREREAVYNNLENMGWERADQSRIQRGWVATEPSLAADNLYNGGQTPSVRLFELSNIGRLAGTSNVGVNDGLRNLIIAETVTMKLRWREYEMLERQLLTKSIMLARKTREASGRL